MESPRSSRRWLVEMPNGSVCSSSRAELPRMSRQVPSRDGASEHRDHGVGDEDFGAVEAIDYRPHGSSGSAGYVTYSPRV